MPKKALSVRHLDPQTYAVGTYAEDAARTRTVHKKSADGRRYVVRDVHGEYRVQDLGGAVVLSDKLSKAQVFLDPQEAWGAARKGLYPAYVMELVEEDEKEIHGNWPPASSSKFECPECVKAVTAHFTDDHAGAKKQGMTSAEWLKHFEEEEQLGGPAMSSEQRKALALVLHRIEFIDEQKRIERLEALLEAVDEALLSGVGTSALVDHAEHILACHEDGVATHFRAVSQAAEKALRLISEWTDARVEGRPYVGPTIAGDGERGTS